MGGCHGKFEVVLAPTGVLQEVHVYGKAKSVKCKGPTARLALLEEICGSLKES